MLSELGNFFLAMTLGFGGVQVLSSFWGIYKHNGRYLTLGRVATYLQGGFLTSAFLTLIVAFVVCDFSILTVSLHDHRALPWFYRMAATWGNHEGSLLFFVLIISGVGIAIALFIKNPFLRARALSIQGILTVLFLIFLMITSNPFITLPYLLHEGESLNPLLQDRGLLFHPPLLYLGYVGFSAPYSLALAALWGKEDGETWKKLVRPWVLFAWGALTTGITLGSWWAYYELGWGGWWFWDPVENASLMPWLAGTALLHTLRTGKLYRWSLFLSLLTFGLSLLGTFLVRSGLIMSVHNFAQSPERGLFILSLIGLIMGFAFFLWIWRSPSLQSKSVHLLSREGALLLNSLLLSVGLGTILLGTLYPLWSEWVWGETLAIGTPYFERTFIPLMIPLLILIPIGSLLRNEKESFFQLLLPPLTAAMAAAVIILYIYSPHTLWSLSGIVIAIWVLIGTLMAYLKKRLSLGPTLAHIGVAVSLLGVSAGSGFRLDESRILGVQDQMKVGGLTLTFQEVNEGKGTNYLFQRATLSYPGGALTPEKRLYQPQNALLSETAIMTNGLRDLYVILGPYQGENRWLIRASVIPFAPWIWIGGAIMVLGACVSFFNRRHALLIMLFLLSLTTQADANEEKRASSLQQEVRCPVCAGQSISDSDTEEAEFLRIYISRQLKEGKTEEQIRKDLREKFGNEILFRPPLEAHTLFLWFAPFALLLLILVWIAWKLNKSRIKTK